MTTLTPTQRKVLARMATGEALSFRRGSGRFRQCGETVDYFDADHLERTGYIAEF